MKRSYNGSRSPGFHRAMIAATLSVVMLALPLSGCGGSPANPQATASSGASTASSPAASASAAASGSANTGGLAGILNAITFSASEAAPQAEHDAISGSAKMTRDMAGALAVQPGSDPEMNTENYAAIEERGFVSPLAEALSTFSADVDTASWSNIRRFLNMGMAVPADAVRVEEMINYFPYGYEGPVDDTPFAVHPELGTCPWNTSHLLMRIGIQGRRIDKAALPSSNLVFLLDVSGSMDDPLKLPLVKSAFSLLVEQLKPTDRVSIVTYAGADQVVLEGASGEDRARIQAAINDLAAGGSTAGAQGIITAYQLAERNFLEGGNNRVILATDGDFNVGISSDGELKRLIEREREKGVFLSVLGFGTGNLKDSRMESLADNGNGNYAYIDSLNEARKVLVGEMGGTLFTIAKDVKFQVEFNPAMVKGYRLIGYENRMLAAEDFNNDAKDAGDIGAGHSVTALYELIPATSDEAVPGVDGLKYQNTGTGAAETTSAVIVTDAEGEADSAEGETGSAEGESGSAEGESGSVAVKPSASREWMTVKIRYKAPDDATSRLLEIPIPEEALSARVSDDFTFQAAVAEAGLVLRGSAYASQATMDHAVSLATSVLGADEGGYRSEFVALMSHAGAVPME